MKILEPRLSTWEQTFCSQALSKAFCKGTAKQNLFFFRDKFFIHLLSSLSSLRGPSGSPPGALPGGPSGTLPRAFCLPAAPSISPLLIALPPKNTPPKFETLGGACWTRDITVVRDCTRLLPMCGRVSRQCVWEDKYPSFRSIAFEFHCKINSQSFKSVWWWVATLCRPQQRFGTFFASKISRSSFLHGAAPRALQVKKAYPFSSRDQ